MEKKVKKKKTASERVKELKKALRKIEKKFSLEKKIEKKSTKKENKVVKKEDKVVKDTVKVVKKPKLELDAPPPVPPNPYMSCVHAVKEFSKGKFVARKSFKGAYLCKISDNGFIMLYDPNRWGCTMWFPTIEDILAEDWYII